MTDRTITLRSELVERLEKLAQGRTLDEVVGEILEQAVPPRSGNKNWALAVAEAMEAADIDWIDEPDASARSREHFEQQAYEKWQRTQTSDIDDNA
ncbi:MAG: hypothetical protein KJ065_27445 [Anaerolineae bacterium]|nr:hypothetical protein [Anaerolineae bacterium]